eukprot:scaffold11885_cov129-Isochrysis_galbana.AAC.12
MTLRVGCGVCGFETGEAERAPHRDVPLGRPRLCPEIARWARQRIRTRAADWIGTARRCEPVLRRDCGARGCRSRQRVSCLVRGVRPRRGRERTRHHRSLVLNGQLAQAICSTVAVQAAATRSALVTSHMIVRGAGSTLIGWRTATTAQTSTVPTQGSDRAIHECLDWASRASMRPRPQCRRRFPFASRKESETRADALGLILGSARAEETGERSNYCTTNCQAVDEQDIAFVHVERDIVA